MNATATLAPSVSADATPAKRSAARHVTTVVRLMFAYRAAYRPLLMPRAKLG